MAANTNKRKRGALDHHDSGRNAPGYQKASASAIVQDPTNPEMEAYPALDDGSVSQLLAHNNSEHGLHQNGGNQSATDTAAAALQYHHGLPPNTDASFQTQGSAGDASFLADQSFSMDQLKDGGSKSPTGPGGAKPPVGSEEWHKVRRDNHKEGVHIALPLFPICGALLTAHFS